MADIITYAGVPLTISTPEMQELAAIRFPGPHLFPSAAKGWPGSNVAGLFESPDALELPVRLGSLFWPTGASRFAVGYFLASKEQLYAIREKIASTAISGSGPNNYGSAQTFTMQAGQPGATPTIVTDLYMLPARPFFTASGQPTLYLITLVDERYWWRYKATSDVIADETQTWEDLLNWVASDLGGSFTLDTINPANWGYPPANCDLSYYPAAYVLDALAYNVGQRISRILTGSYFSCDTDTGSQDVADNLANVPFDATLMGGGPFDVGTNVGPNDMAGALPEKIQIAFSDLTIDGFTVVTRDLVSLDASLTPTRTGAVKAWRANRLIDTTDATLTDQLNTYTESLGKAWAYWQQMTTNYCFAGIVHWSPEAASDHVEWHLSQRHCYTAVRRPVWDDGVTLLLPSGPIGISGSGADSGSGASCMFGGIPISQLIMCTDTGTAIRDGCLSVENGVLVLRDPNGNVIWSQ